MTARPRVVSLVPSVTETLLAWGVTPAACTRFCEQPDLPHVGGTKDPLAEREAAIVSPVRGTTRDWLRVEIDWDGRRIELRDTAGRDDLPDALTGEPVPLPYGLQGAGLVERVGILPFGVEAADLGVSLRCFSTIQHVHAHPPLVSNDDVL